MIQDIDLRKYWICIGSLSSKIDSHKKFIIQCARENAASAGISDQERERHVLQSISEGPSRGRGRGRGASSVRGRKPCPSCNKEYSSSYLPRHITICKPVPVPVPIPETVPEPVHSSIPTSTPVPISPLDPDAVIEEGRNVFFSFDIGLAINTDSEITLSQLEDEVFSLERSILDIQQAGPSCHQVGELYGPPRQHNLYGSGDMSSQLVDDFGQPICRMVTRSMSRSSQN